MKSAVGTNFRMPICTRKIVFLQTFDTWESKERQLYMCMLAKSARATCTYTFPHAHQRIKAALNEKPAAT